MQKRKGDARRSGASKIGASKIGASKIGAMKSGARKSGAKEIRAKKSDARKGGPTRRPEKATIASPIAAEASPASPIRVVVAKPGLDGHDRGAKVIARALRDAGMEVIYTGIRQTPEQIVATVVQEDADVLAISILSGAHNTLLPQITRLTSKQHLEDLLILAGGIIPDEDVPGLKDAGIAEVFGPGTNTGSIVEFIRRHVRSRPWAQEPPASSGR